MSKVNIYAHRGLWHYSNEQNTLSAFQSALLNGFGIETDIRAYDGVLFVSHDHKKKYELQLKTVIEELGDLLKEVNFPILLNIKEDGLIPLIIALFNKKKIKYLLFDSSFPELLKIINYELPFLFRISEYESHSKIAEKSVGYWVDTFTMNWITKEVIYDLKKKLNNLYFVSPELHGLNPSLFWQFMKDSEISFSLCTDKATQARAFFS